ncbi:hypothetical protein [Algoriphagus formosus]|uniref:hypothetical protein n=1 Tax=Algoriphagus formosus TaxID=2007308 RepID=UPI003F71E230
MKTVKLILGFLVLLGFASCGEDENPSNQLENFFFKLEVDGKTYESRVQLDPSYKQLSGDLVCYNAKNQNLMCLVAGVLVLRNTQDCNEDKPPHCMAGTALLDEVKIGTVKGYIDISFPDGDVSSSYFDGDNLADFNITRRDFEENIIEGSFIGIDEESGQTFKGSFKLPYS